MPFLTALIKSELWGFVFDTCCFVSRMLHPVILYSGGRQIAHLLTMEATKKKYEEEND